MIPLAQPLFGYKLVLYARACVRAHTHSLSGISLCYVHTHMHAHPYTHPSKRMCVSLLQYGPYSDVSEITTAAGPPGQCKAPCISFTPDGCVLVSWEVSQAQVLR